MLKRISIIPQKNHQSIAKLCIELAHCLGLMSTAMTFPLVVREKESDSETLYLVLDIGDAFSCEKTGNCVNINIREDGEDILQACKYLLDNFAKLSENFQNFKKEGTLKDFTSSTNFAKEVPLFSKDKMASGLEALFSRGFLLKDLDHDLLPDDLDLSFYLGENASFEEVASIANFAARFGMETTNINLPIVIDEISLDKNVFLIEKAQQAGLKIEGEKTKKIVLFGEGEELLRFSSNFCENFPQTSLGVDMENIVSNIKEAFKMNNIDGQLSYLGALESTQDDLSCFFSPKINYLDEKTKNNFSGADLKSYKDEKIIYEKEYSIPWEVDVFTNILEEKVFPVTKAGDEIKIYAALSEDKSIREKLSANLANRCDELKLKLSDISLLCSYKQGFSWLEESVMPKLKKNGKISKIDIAVKPFLPKGQTDWKDVDGAVPGHQSGANEKTWHDLPIRFIQEMYPADDVLAAGLGIHRDNISFSLYEGNDDISFKINAYDEKNKSLFTDDYKSWVNERPYLSEYPQLGLVHPATGYIEVLVNGKTLLSQRIETDVEAVWEIYQDEILPKLRAYSIEKAGESPSEEAQPFFSTALLELNLSEPNERLEVREDIISSLDGLHEDLYFAGQDYFVNFGQSTGKNPLDAPGQILPLIKKTDGGKPYFKFTLFDHLEEKPLIRNGDKEITGILSDIKIKIAKITGEKSGHKLSLDVSCKVDLSKIIPSYLKLLEKNMLAINADLKGISNMEFVLNGATYTASIPPVPDVKKDLDIRNINLYEKELIGYEQYLEVIENLKRVEGIFVYKVGESYEGRDIYAIELAPKLSGYVSRVRRIATSPSQVINARHHANEVSSTNAAFMLLKELLINPEYADLPNQMSLVIVPFENADGAAIHYKLQEDNPYWKLHVARFNAVGKEFYYEHFKEHTIHTEAMAFTRVWEEALPDVVVDNHGVPSHEWEQQFSGYTSPRYRGFWLPRSLIYGYFWTVSNDEYKGNMQINKKVEEIVADAFRNDVEISALNTEWGDRFKKYANAWLPKLFPANYYKDMINYWIPYAYDPEHRYVSIKFPWITALAYTSEVADETAQGDYLYLCARTHFVHDIEIIRMMTGAASVYEDTLALENGRLTKKCRRHRPLIV